MSIVQLNWHRVLFLVDSQASSNLQFEIVAQRMIRLGFEASSENHFRHKRLKVDVQYGHVKAKWDAERYIGVPIQTLIVLSPDCNPDALRQIKPWVVGPRFIDVA